MHGSEVKVCAVASGHTPRPRRRVSAIVPPDRERQPYERTHDPDNRDSEVCLLRKAFAVAVSAVSPTVSAVSHADVLPLR